MSEFENQFLFAEEDLEDDDHDNFVKNAWHDSANGTEMVTLIAAPQLDAMF